MGVHLFVDESRRSRTYLMVAARVEPAQLGQTRSLMRSLCLPGERRIHLQAEHDSRRRKIIAELVGSGARAHVYLGAGRPDRVRATLLGELVRDAVLLGASRLVLESCGPAADRTDRAVIHRALANHPASTGRLSYEHLCPHEDPALAVADAIAWAYGAGGDWRRRVGPALGKVADLGTCP